MHRRGGNRSAPCTQGADEIVTLINELFQITLRGNGDMALLVHERSLTTAFFSQSSVEERVDNAAAADGAREVTSEVPDGAQEVPV